MKTNKTVFAVCAGWTLALLACFAHADTITIARASPQQLRPGQTLDIALAVTYAAGIEVAFPCPMTLTAVNSTTPLISVNVSAPPSMYKMSIPASAPGGTYILKWTCENGLSATAPTTLTIVSVPTIQEFGPSPAASVGDQTIQGFEFGNIQGNSFIDFMSFPDPKNSFTVASVTSWSDTSIRYTLPNVQPGLYSMAVHTDNGYSIWVQFPIINTVWGFADLHTHPASHLAFGSDEHGENGPFWGTPAHDFGLDRATSLANLASDLPACPSYSIDGFLSGFSHNNNVGIDFVKGITDKMIVDQLDQTACPGCASPPWVHQSAGYPTFGSSGGHQGWPAALSVDHQVMHIDNIYRAYQGGLRLMFASVTDDEVLSKLWKLGFNLTGNPMPTHDQSFDLNSARRQLTYITNLVNANSTWMKIVSSPGDARQAINSNPPQLAVVLSLEMDSLSLKDIQSLVQQFGVAHVIPVHLANNNSFGGTAIYNDTFNGLSNFINGFPERPIPDANVNFRLATPVQQLQPITPSSLLGPVGNGISLGAAFIVGADAYGPETSAAVIADVTGVELLPAGAFGYMPLPSSPTPGKVGIPGQINSQDLASGPFFALMQMGLLLDVAHMGQLTASTALSLAQKYNYPLMDSHTGLRCDSANPPYSSGPTTGFPSVSCDTKSPAGALPFTQPVACPTLDLPTVDERALPVSQLQVIKQLGGVIGLGLVPSVWGCSPAENVDTDPVSTWIHNYSIALELMGGKNVAIGTDANGLSPLIQQDTIPTSTPPYTINVASRYGCGAGCPALPLYQFGKRTYNFQEDGIANYGLLPDFIQAASESRPIQVPSVPNAACKQACTVEYSQCVEGWSSYDHPAGAVSPCLSQEANCIQSCPHTGGGYTPETPTKQIAALFHSAEDTIEMWEKVESALIITTPNALQGQVGTPYSQTLSARGGTLPYKWSIQSGSSLPPHLTLSNDGILSGVATQGGSYAFTVVVQDSSSPPLGPSPLTVTITMFAPPCPTGQVALLCGDPPIKSCAHPPAKCPTPICRPGYVAKNGNCVPQGAPPK